MTLRALLVLVLAAVAARADDAPRLHGKTAREWAAQLENPDARPQAMNALAQLGPAAREAVPLLLQMLKEKDAGSPNALSGVAQAAAETLAHVGPGATPGLLRGLAADYPRVRAGSALALGLMRPPQTKAAEPLRAALKDRDEQVRLQAALSLLKIEGKSEGVVPVLAEALKGKTPALRLRAAVELGQVGAEAKAAVPALVEALRDEALDLPGEETNSAAVNALAAIGGADALAAAARDREPLVRARALLALANVRPVPRDAESALKAGLKDGDPGVRLVAAEQLWNLKRDPAAVPVLLELLRGADLEPSNVAAFLLGQIGPPAKEAIPTLIEQLNDPRRVAAAQAGLMFFGADAARPVAALLGTDEGTRAEVLLRAMLPASLPAVRKALESDRARVRAAAAEVLASPGGHGPRVLDDLRDAARDSDARVRFPALVGLARHGPEADAGKVAEGLAGFAKEKQFPQRLAAAQALSLLGKRGKKALPALRDVLKERGDPALRFVAARLVLDHEPDNADAAAVLVEEIQVAPANAAFVPPKLKGAELALAPLLLDREATIRGRAVLALGGMLPESAGAVPLLVKALEDEDDGVASAAAGALATLGPRARAALPVIKKQLPKASPARTYALLSLASRIEGDGFELLLDAALRPATRPVAVRVLTERPERGKATVDLLSKSLTAPEPGVRLAAAGALMGTAAAPDAVSALDLLLKDPELTARRQAAAVLSRAAGVERRAVPLLVQALKDPDRFVPFGDAGGPSSVWVEAMQGLGSAGPAGRAAIPAARGLLSSDNAVERGMAAWLLGEIGPAAREEAPALRKLLKDSDPDVRLASAVALTRLGPGEDALPVLLAALKDPATSANLVTPAMQAVARLGAAAVPGLVRQIKARNEPAPTVGPGPDPVGRAFVAVRVLGMIGREAADAGADLVAVLTDGELDRRPGGADLRAAAVQALLATSFGHNPADLFRRAP